MIKVAGFSFNALLTRLNAAWFSGEITTEQATCLRYFSSVWLLYTRMLGRDVPVTWLAYVLATTYHETAATMRPIAEFGKGKGRPYGAPDHETGQAYYGRGYVQLTWKVNYQAAQKTTLNLATLTHDVPFVAQPDLALDPMYAAQIAINGMCNGWFTGKCLANYLTTTHTDYVQARRIINGMDKAELIAEYAEQAEMALRLALGEAVPRAVVHYGDRGADVRELQLLLGVAPDGIAGADTIAALTAYQRTHELADDGVCGLVTWAKLSESV